MSDMAWIDYSREIWEAAEGEPYSTRRIGSSTYHENDVPDEDELL